MNADIEVDELELVFFTWENIENSEDYILLEERGCNYEQDDCDTDEYANIIKYLQRVSPSIRWRTTHNGSDRHGARPSIWRVICVPVSQFSEAQYIFNRFLAGDDLENYCHTDKYPELYDKLPNRQSKLKDHVLRFYNLLLEYEETLFRKRLKLIDLFEKLTEILPEMYSCANLLPYVLEAPYLSYQGNMSLDMDMDLTPYDEFFVVPNPYAKDKSVESLLLSELLQSIYEDIEQGLIAFSQDDPGLIAAAVNDWKAGFSRKHGWGNDILIALFVIHQAKRKIKNECRNG